MNRKIGILSVYNHNYGSILQAYALQQVLENMGHDTEILVYKKTNYVRQAARLLYYPLLKATAKRVWKDVYCKFFHRDIYGGVLAGRETAFCEFIRKNMHFSETYIGRSALIRACDNYDCFVLGSDQVWNPMNLGGDYYTMTFIGSEKKKVTYAPSFGVARIPKNQEKKTKQYLERIDFISVREPEGQKIVAYLTGRTAEVVVDPTLLVDREFWDLRKGGRLISDSYILCYFISPNPSYRKFSENLRKKTGLKIVSIPHVDEFVRSDVGYADYEPTEIGPFQFINLIANAAYVCTDSFHGSVFSAIYERTFFTFTRYQNDEKDSTNSRLYSFLKMTGLEDRLFRPDQPLQDRDFISMEFSSAKERMEGCRRRSMDYLEHALKDER